MKYLARLHGRISTAAIVFAVSFPFGLIASSEQSLAGDPAGLVAAKGTAPVTVVNLNPSSLPGLTAATSPVGKPVGASLGDLPQGSPLVVVQATAGRATDIGKDDARKLGDYVRGGGSLFLTLSQTPGSGPFRLAFMLPSTAWQTQIENAYRGGPSGQIAVASVDPAFTMAAAQGAKLSFHFPLRIVAAEERGEERYERFARTIPYIDQAVSENNDFWTRPLIDRDWRVRAWGDDAGHTPLLITGRYGAGRVAILGGSLLDLEATSAGKNVERAAVSWLLDRAGLSEPPSASVPAIISTASVDKANRSLLVTVSNRSADPLIAQLVCRLLTWEGAYIDDTVRPVTVAGNATQSFTVSIPPRTSTSYQSLGFRDAYIARIGLLSASGADLLGEKRVAADFSPEVTVAIATDTVRALARPFDIPTDGLLAQRLGLPLDSYAYAPGQTVHATISIANGVSNIAPQATLSDETQPENSSLSCLNDDSVLGMLNPLDGVKAYGVWIGKADTENILTFTFAHPMRIQAVALIGSQAETRSWRANPGAAVVEIDGRKIAESADLDARFTAGNGRAELRFAPTTGTALTVRFPWIAQMRGGDRRAAPQLGEIEIAGGRPGDGAAATGQLTVNLIDALSGGRTIVKTAPVNLSFGQTTSEPLSFVMPTGVATKFLRLSATFGATSADIPLLDIDPAHPLHPLSAINPPRGAYMGFIVTRGFRNGTTIGAGNDDAPGNWESRDDLVYAYENRLKQTGAGARELADRLYVTNDDFRHYCTPWTDFPNGENYFDVATPTLVARMKKRGWNGSDIVRFGFGDRWDTGPSMSSVYTWQEMIAFDEFLRKGSDAGLTPGTRSQVEAQINGRYLHQWTAWQMRRYVASLETMRDAFAAEGKTLIIGAQGTPIVPSYVQQKVASIVRGMSDDSTWGMANESVPFTTGRQMAFMAYNPVWQMSTLLQWGWNSAILDDPHWHAPVGATEPSRRHYYDRAWRGMIGPDGNYRSMHTFGYNRNGGYAYTMNANDWQQMWNTQERHSLLAPESPLGAGVVLGTSKLGDPRYAEFTGGGMGGSSLDEAVGQIADAIRYLHDAGVSIPFSTNASSLAKWSGTTPLLLLNLCDFSDTELTSVKSALARGAHVAAFAGPDPLSPAAAALFGVTSDGAAVDGHKAGEYAGRPIIAGKGTLLIEGEYEGLDEESGRALAPLLHGALDLPITYDDGTAGYGFTMGSQSYIEVEDWMEQGREVKIRLRANPLAKYARACEINEHRPVAVARDGDEWLFTLPIRPGDADVICVEEHD